MFWEMRQWPFVYLRCCLCRLYGFGFSQFVWFNESFASCPSPFTQQHGGVEQSTLCVTPTAEHNHSRFTIRQFSFSPLRFIIYFRMKYACSHLLLCNESDRERWTASEWTSGWANLSREMKKNELQLNFVSSIFRYINAKGRIFYFVSLAFLPFFYFPWWHRVLATIESAGWA